MTLACSASVNSGGNFPLICGFIPLRGCHPKPDPTLDVGAICLTAAAYQP